MGLRASSGFFTASIFDLSGVPKVRPLMDVGLCNGHVLKDCIYDSDH